MIAAFLRHSTITLAVVLAIVPTLHADDKTKVQELEKTIAVLRSDNEALHEQLAAFTAKKSSRGAAELPTT